MHLISSESRGDCSAYFSEEDQFSVFSLVQGLRGSKVKPVAITGCLLDLHPILLSAWPLEMNYRLNMLGGSHEFWMCAK